MFISRLLLSPYLRTGAACRVGRRALFSESYSDSVGVGTDSNETTKRPHDKKTGLLVQFFRDKEGKRELSKAGQELDHKSGGKLTRYLNQLTDFKVGDAFVVTDVSTYEAVALCCVGPKDASINDVEGLDVQKENVRCGFAAGAKALSSLLRDVHIQLEDHLEDKLTNAALEGTQLVQWKFAKYYVPEDSDKREGARLAVAQNWARYLSQMPVSKMTPKGVAEEAKARLDKAGAPTTIHKRADIVKKKMTAFLAVTEGSCAEPILLESEYKAKHHNSPRVLVVAKGVTFDSGGLCLKSQKDMLEHLDVTGAAVALGAMWGLATLQVPINVKLVVPLCENMISGQCMRVGDVVSTLSGLKVKIEDTDLEGRLLLADALTYGQKNYKPNYILSVASLTPGITAATGGGCYGCFTKNDSMWEVAQYAGAKSGDRPWRFPVWDYYSKQITGLSDDKGVFDLKNRGSGIASHCIGAAFIDKFVSPEAAWLHYDITGVGRVGADGAPPYLAPALTTGRPTRALINTIIGLSESRSQEDSC